VYLFGGEHVGIKEFLIGGTPQKAGASMKSLLNDGKDGGISGEARPGGNNSPN
jgi:hypothetical protein